MQSGRLIWLKIDLTHIDRRDRLRPNAGFVQLFAHNLWLCSRTGCDEN